MKTFTTICCWVIGIAIVASVLPTACTSSSDATRALRSAGYTNVKITGWRPFMKGKEDFYSTGFEATGADGRKVTGAVTGGLIFKGNTIRTD